MHLQITPIDPIIIRHDHRRQLNILIGDRLKRTIQLRDDQIQPTQHLMLELNEVLPELVPRLTHQITRTFQ